MHRIFIATVVALTVIITGASATPARADGDDLAKALAGIAALAIIGKAISDRNDNAHVTHNRQVYRHQHIAPRPLPKQVSRKALPAQCLRHVEGRNGTRRVFGARCLDRNYRFSNQLPNQCARQVQTHRGWRWAYGARCLRNQGYHIARH